MNLLPVSFSRTDRKRPGSIILAFHFYFSNSCLIKSIKELRRDPLGPFVLLIGPVGQKDHSFLPLSIVHDEGSSIARMI